MKDYRIYWIWLAERAGQASALAVKLINRYGNASSVYAASAEDIERDLSDVLTPREMGKARQILSDKSTDVAERILEDAASLGQRVIVPTDEDYPRSLASLRNAPMVLYVMGTLPRLRDELCIAVVGTRTMSDSGRRNSYAMGYGLASGGAVVVSGMALGCDGMALSGAISAGGKTIAVLGGGVDVIYPKDHTTLYSTILKSGAIISEYPPGTRPSGYNFPVRNRIISGLSAGSVIVEASDGSGALITASQAAEQGRDVFVIPGNVDVAACAGSNALLRDGAIAVSTGWDILSEYVALFPDQIRKDGLPSMQTLYPDEESAIRAAERPAEKVAQKSRHLKNKDAEKPEADKKAIDNEPKSLYSEKIDIEDPSLTGDERTILALLRDGERLVDDVIAESGLTSGTTLSTLTLLEVKGLIRRLPGRYVCLSR